jgi:hypothetical protein
MGCAYSQNKLMKKKHPQKKRHGKEGSKEVAIYGNGEIFDI